MCAASCRSSAITSTAYRQRFTTGKAIGTQVLVVVNNVALAQKVRQELIARRESERAFPAIGRENINEVFWMYDLQLSG